MLPLNVLALAAAVLAYSPTGGYAPANVTCPDVDSLVRPASAISDNEKEWLEKRHEITDQYLEDFLDRAGLDYDISKLNRSINIALAFSGGGYRAMLNGAGQIAALDERTDGAEEHGLAGLLQSATYLAGLSGGNWLTGTLALNNWTSVQAILDDKDNTIWDLEDSIFSSGGWNVFSTVGRFDDISDAIGDKRDAGFNTSLTDIWGRALSYQFFGTAHNGGSGLTFSGIRDFDHFKNASMPFPFSVADGRTPGSNIVNANSTVFEFNPFELGSWDPSLYAFTDLKYIGSDVDNGAPTTGECIGGFDNGGFVLGTSSSLFNQFLLQLNTTGLSGVVYDLIEDFLQNLNEDYDDVAIYGPNPFYNTPYGEIETIADSDYLYLVDGGEDLQNVPLAPLLQPERDVDVIFAFDNSADTSDSFPNGTALVATYERQFGAQGNKTSFPYVPDTGTFIHHNLTTKPTFFGCYKSNLTDLASIPPLVVYMPNIAYTTWSNTSTFKMSYENKERNAVIQNGFESATRYNLTIDDDWPLCVACAIVQRSLESRNESQSEECKACFDEYCWDGTLYTQSINYTNGYYSNNYTSSGNTKAGTPDDSDDVSSSSHSTATAASSSSHSSSKSSGAGVSIKVDGATMFASVIGVLSVMLL